MTTQIYYDKTYGFMTGHELNAIPINGKHWAEITEQEKTLEQKQTRTQQSISILTTSRRYERIRTRELRRDLTYSASAIILIVLLFWHIS